MFKDTVKRLKDPVC